MELPDGPKTPPWLQTLQWIFRPLETLEARARGYGDTFRALGQQMPPFLYFSSPEALEAIFTAKTDQVSSAEGNQLLEPLLGENALILLDGKRHQRQRQLLMPPFHGDRMRSYGSLICEITQQISRRWVLNQPFVVRPAMQEISLRVILSTVFGLHEGQRYEQLRHVLVNMLEAFGSTAGFMLLYYRFLQKDWGAQSPWGRFLRQKQQIKQLLSDEIDDRRAHPDSDRTDILALLLAARDEAGQPMSDAELRDELMTLLFAGHETTASALAWALYWIAKLPEVRSKLKAELDSLSPDADPMTIARLPYLSAICQETLRLYPIAINAFPRVVKQPMDLLGYSLEPGTILLPSIYLAHQRSEVYPNPKQFRPERFLERQFSPYEYLPFGGGDRRCIGAAFALFEMKLVLVTLLLQSDLELASHQPIKPVRRGLTIAPPSHLKMVVKRSV
ncbi:cytochrome P450 [Phormidesmis priestleyi ULC007]|uniref:Cytochrome P450 n=1 Tax=Phormidesmis priestleyi ULC007 TaxID=1920490 RepID=A0A2T1DKB7_9CYAN|nr:cytochrome P450 [Phormidesmis priestleyi]PSB20916.1 cytochrome P450 [Phormidesmis priestleyi ULC007]PZO51871.1 MAG: cytochrome P450 [Phormidesmis priestleyi]